MPCATEGPFTETDFFYLFCPSCPVGIAICFSLTLAMLELSPL